MSVSLYDIAVPTYLRVLRNLIDHLEKAEAHAATAGADLDTYVDARLAPDMYALPRQIQLVSDAAKGGAARLAGVTPPSMPDEETTIAELKSRLHKTIAFVETITADQVSEDDDRLITLKTPGRTLSFTARDFILSFSLPNLYFHAAMAYGLLRKEGVPLSKLDFLTGSKAAALS